MARKRTTTSATFEFSNITIDDVILHRIRTKNADGEFQEPVCSSALADLQDQGLDALRQRMTDALGNRAHGLEVSISDIGRDSFFQTAAGMLRCKKPQFVKGSKDLAQKLAKAQLSTNAPAGMLLVIRGRITSDKFPFVAAIKAELDDGFTAKEADVEYIAELLLTRTQRMFKIGLLVQMTGAASIEPVNFRVFLFDHLLTSTESKTTAAYFLTGFLGMSVLASSKRLTQVFFEHTKKFIDQAPLAIDARIELYEALRSELRSTKPSLSTTSFAREHLHNLESEYLAFMESEKFPRNAVTKDVEYVQHAIRRRRKMNFTNDVQINTPPDKLNDLVKIEKTDKQAGFTIVKIKGVFLGET
jgi:hypothetical protein